MQLLGRRRSSNLMLYGFVLLSCGFFFFVFMNMPSSGPTTYIDINLQSQFVTGTTARPARRLDRDRPSRFRPKASTNPIDRNPGKPWGVKDHEAEKKMEDERKQQEEEKRQREQEEEQRREEEEEEAQRREEEEEEAQRREEEELENRRKQEQEEAEQRARQEEERERERENDAKDEDVEEEDQKGSPADERARQEILRRLRKNTSVRIPKSKLKIALTSAFRGDRYTYMAKLTSETKRHYADIHGYTFFEDNDMISEDASWHARSAIRTKALMRHFDDFDWAYWSDVDIMITNPTVKLESLMKSGAHVILSRDWGDRQVNPGSILMKTSAVSKRFIEDWEKAIEEVTDDLRAFEKVMHDHPDYERKGQVVYLPQQMINPYHHVETDDNGELRRQPQPHPDGHHLWKEDSLLVHIINCLRTNRNDCQILADYYYDIARENFAKLGYELAPRES